MSLHRPPPQVPSLLRRQEGSLLNVCVSWGLRGSVGGQEGGSAFSSTQALGAASASAPNPQAATAFEINCSVCLSSASCPSSSSQVPVVHPLTPSGSCTHLSPARLACSPFLTLPLTEALSASYSSPFVSCTCPCSPSQAPFLFPPFFLAFGFSL